MAFGLDEPVNISFSSGRISGLEDALSLTHGESREPKTLTWVEAEGMSSLVARFWHIVKYADEDFYGLTWHRGPIRPDEYWQPMIESADPDALKAFAQKLENEINRCGASLKGTE